MRLLSLLEEMKVPVFSTINHKDNVAFVGMGMKEARVISFGNSDVETFLMQENTELALELPLKMLVRESREASMLSWNDPAWIARCYGMDKDNETVKKCGL